AALGSSPTLAVEDLCDLFAAMTRLPQLRYSRDQSRISAEPFAVGDWTDHLVLGPNPTAPMAFDANLLALSDDFDYYTRQQQPNEVVGFSVCVAPRPPQRGQIVGQSTDGDELLRARRRRSFAKAPFVLSLEPSLFSQCLFPIPLERSRHEPVLGLARMILTL